MNRMSRHPLRNLLHTALRAALWGAAMLAASPAVVAHDFWIEPSSFAPKAGDLVTLRLRVGQFFAGDAVPRRDDLIESFLARGPAGEAAIAGRDGSDPGGYMRPDRPGFVVVGYQSRGAFVELPAPAFEAYLREEGLDRILDERAWRGTRAQSGREIFRRCAKVILRVDGDGFAIPAADAARPLGLRLEIVPATEPGPRTARRFVLLYEGRPLAGALVVALRRGDAARTVSARSDARGEVALDLSAAGAWLVKAVHMVPAARDDDADWASWWASLTFEEAP